MRIPHLALGLVITLIWGFNFIVGKAGTEALSPMVLTAGRFVLLSAMLVPFVRIVPGQMGRVFITAMCMGAGHFGLLFAALQHSDNVSVIAVGVQLSVPFSVLLSVIVLHEHVGVQRWAGIAAAFLGMMLIGFEPEVFDNLTALILVVLAALAAAVGMVTMRGMQGVTVFNLQGWIALMSWPILILLSSLTEPGALSVLLEPDWIAWGAVAYTAVLASLVGHGGMYFLLQRYEVSLVSTLMLLAPVLGIIFGVTVWGDELTARIVTGAAITIAGVAAIALNRARPEEVAEV